MIQNINSTENRYITFTDMQQESISMPQSMNQVYERYMKLLEHERQITQTVYNEEDTQSALEKYLNDIKEEVKKALDISRKEMIALKAMGYDIEHMSIEEIRSLKEGHKENMPKDYTRFNHEDAVAISIKEKLEVITSQKESMFLESLKEKGDLTVNKLYENSFKGIGKKAKVEFSDEQISKILGMNGLPQTKGNMWAARLMMTNQKEVTAKDITKLQNIRAVIQGLTEKSEGQIHLDTPLMVDRQVMYTKEDIDHIKNQLNAFTDQEIAHSLKKEDILTISSLMKGASSSDALDTASKANTTNSASPSSTHTQIEHTHNIRKSLEYISKHLTPQKAQRLSKDMPLEDYAIEEVANRLKSMDEAMARDILRSSQLMQTPENLDLVSNVLANVEGIDQNIPNTALKVGELIKQGVNPYTSSIDELTGKLYLSGIRDIQQATADLIEALKANGALTSSQENKLLGLYQTITTIVNQEESIKAQVLKNGLSVSIDGLSEAAKHVREETARSVASYETGSIAELADTIKAIKQDLAQVNNLEIASVIRDNKLVTIASLREALYKNTQKVLGAKDDKETSDYTGAIDGVKKQIKQVCAKLTAEAVQKISLNMPLESIELSKLVKELTEVEESVVRDALQFAALPETEENTNIVKNTLFARQMILENRKEALGLEIGSNNTILIKEMHEALMTYGENETLPEGRFGETSAKVSDQIEGYLMRHNIPFTKENELAARALLANKMELTQENIEKVVPMLEKLDAFIKEMTPQRAASMIKEGLNPYLSSVDGILEWAAKEEFPALKMSLSEAIVKLEDSGGITKEQKSSMLGLYRILDTAEKNKEGVIGYLYKNDLPLTIEKLNEAASYIDEKKHINTAIDQNYGMLEDIKYDHKTARMMISEAKEHIEKVTSLVESFESAKLPFDENNVAAFKNMDRSLYKMIEEAFQNEAQAFQGMDTLPPSFTQKLEGIKNIHPEAIHTLMQNEIPMTISHLYWMDRLIQNPQTFTELIKETPVKLTEYPTKMKDMRKYLDEIEDEANIKKHAAIEQGNMLSYKGYKQIKEVINLQKQLTDKGVVYQIPFSLNGEFKLVNIYNKRIEESSKNKDRTRVTIIYETKILGKLKTELEIKDKSIRYKVYASDLEAAEKLKKHETDLKTFIKQIGYQVEEGNIHTQQDEEASLSKLRYKQLNLSQFEQIG